MTTEMLNAALQRELEELEGEGRAKPVERVIRKVLPPDNGYGPRFLLTGMERPFLKMNSNSYLSLARHPRLIEAADRATREFGVGPGAVRFIDGTYTYHQDLESRIASFTRKGAAKIFNSAYTANCGLALAISNGKTHWVGDQLNHNSIIRAMRIAGVPKTNKSIYKHNDMTDLEACLDGISGEIERVIVIFDGVYSMRGDTAPIDQIVALSKHYQGRFKDGVITVVDDSHGIGAFGKTGRGTPEFCGATPDILVGTFGKAFGVNGGYIAADPTIIEAVRQKADTYIYTNPLSVADCAAALTAIDICDSEEGLSILENLEARKRQFRTGLEELGRETIEGHHPVIPMMIRNTQKTREHVQCLFDNGILAVGLTYPVVPQGDESLRFQMNGAHTTRDIDYVLGVLKTMN